MTTRNSHWSATVLNCHAVHYRSKQRLRNSTVIGKAPMQVAEELVTYNLPTSLAIRFPSRYDLKLQRYLPILSFLLVHSSIEQGKRIAAFNDYCSTACHDLVE